jgi:hypothetical protein
MHQKNVNAQILSDVLSDAAVYWKVNLAKYNAGESGVKID